ncbi:MAG TPA: HD domain-containing protein [Nitrososphaera sp.]|nr:HD domain-containing protein [Nitrososphaera sp.]
MARRGKAPSTSSVRRAEQFARSKHRHMVRKDGKTLYWVHLQQVVDNLSRIGIKDTEILCAGWLHDTIEDTDTDYDELKENFGERVARIVAQVTKDKTLPETEREQKFCDKLSTASWDAMAVKLCDLWANMADIQSGYQDRIAREQQIGKKLRYFNSIRKGLVQNSPKIPGLAKCIDEINEILKRYEFAPVSLI